MTFTRVSTIYQNAISSPLKGLEDENRVHTAGTHEPDDPDSRRVLKAAYPCQIGSSIGTPITTKGNNFWIGFNHEYLLYI
jgi:hypothetical protein